MPPEEPPNDLPAEPPPHAAQAQLVVLLMAALVPNEANLRDLDNLTPAQRAELLALGESMRDEGQKQPCRVVRRPDGLYLIVSGHRRYYAARLVGMRSLTCLAYEAAPSESELLVDQLIENGQRVDFSDIEKMEGFQRLMRLNGWTPKRLAAAVHVSEGQVSRVLTLKRLCPEVQALVRDGSLKGTLAYHIARVGVPDRQRELAAQVLAGMTREVLEVRVRELLKGAPRRQPRPPVITVPFTGLESTAKALSAHADEMRAAARRGFTDDDYALKLRKRGKA
jgi:ParB family chromosome partitioning protein